MRDFHHLSQPCHDNFLSVFKYNIIFALENQRRAPVLRGLTRTIFFVRG